MVNVFIGGLADSVSESQLNEWFSQYGTVHRTQVIRDRGTGHSRRFGFCEMPDATEAQAAIEGLNGCEFEGRLLKVDVAREQRRPIPAVPRPETNYRDVYIERLSASTTTDDLKALFGQAARVTDARIILDSCGVPRGIAFVTVASREEAERVVRQFNGTSLDGSEIQMEVCGPFKGYNGPRKW
jgi:RNA recognition motif-containing protein